MALIVDPAGAYGLRDAMWVGRWLEDLSYYWYEEPLPNFDIAGYAESCRVLDIPVPTAQVVPGSICLAA